ncbi:hypothetical protein [Streptomyces sp. NPDC056987]|uniref:hypothetical protein n=1 Tax=Streptomyces sp. NPDC056987 TaxID=3345988 RepID=UPI00363F96B9
MPRGPETLLDGGSQFEHTGRSREEENGAVAAVLDEPLAARGEDRGVQKPTADQDVRPGAGLSGRRAARAGDTGVDDGTS